MIPTFQEEVLYTLCRHAPDNDVTLPVAYYHSVSPSITTSKALEAYYLTLCRSSITEAFYFSRAQGDLNHRVLFEKLINFVLAQSSGAIKAIRGVELINLPFSETEESWLQSFLREGKGSYLQGAKDTLIIRSLATGLPGALGNLKTRGSHKIDGVNWATLKSSIQTGSTIS